jgi:hypothetical protein
MTPGNDTVMKRLFPFLPLFACASSLWGQASYTGTVVDAASKKPLDAVAVTLLAADSGVVAYTYTDARGAFAVDRRENGRLLSFSSMGYERTYIPAGRYADGTVVSLREAPLKIREVKVTTRRVRMSNDTLIFSVSGFKTPQDRSVEDVLKRLPGIEVTENGTIKYQGQAISELQVEGMNLLGARYSLGSKNIPAKMVKDVQVLRHHQPIAALRGRGFSDNVALNLRLEDGARNRLVKIVDLGAGVGDNPDALWENRLMGMLFGRKAQNLSMYKNGNTGSDISSEVVPLARAGSAQIIRGGQMGQPDFFSMGTPGSSNVRRDRYASNDAHLLAVNHLYKPDRKTDWRLQLIATHGKNGAESSQRTTYFYPLETVVVDEGRHVTGQENKASGELVYQLNDSSTYVKNELKGEIGLRKGWMDVTVNGAPTRQVNRPSRRNVRNDFQLVRNFGNRSFSLYSANSYSDLPQRMTVYPGMYDALLNGGEPYAALSQEARSRDFHSSTYTYFQHRLAGWFVRYRAGVEYGWTRMTSRLTADDRPVDGERYGNDLRLNTANLYLEPSVTYKTATWNLSFALPISYYHSGLDIDIPIREKLTLDRFIPSPRLDVRYVPSGMWELNASSTYTAQAPDIRRLYAGYLFSSYRSASAYEPTLAFDRSWDSRLGAKFNNPLTGLFASLSVFRAANYRETIYGYRNTEGFLSMNEARRHPHTSLATGFNGRVSKTFSWLRLFLAANAGYTVSDGKVLLDGELTSTSVRSWSLGLDYSFQPLPFLIVDGKSDASLSSSRLGYAGSPRSEAWSFSHRMDMNLLFSRRWRAQWSHSLTHDNQNGGATYFMDASVTYTHRLFDVEVTARNMLDHSRLERVRIGSVSTQYTNLALRPREWMAKMRFSF